MSSKDTAGGNEDILTLARTIYGEARSEPVEGREAVGSVIMNRAKSGRFAGSISEVCMQPKQFSCWQGGDRNLAVIKSMVPGANQRFDECHELAERIIAGSVPDRTNGATHYYSKLIAPPGWTKAPARMTAEVGTHRFYAGVV